MSAHAAPTHTAAAPRFRAEHAVAVIVALFGILAVAALPADLPQGAPANTTCAWNGTQLVLSGSVVNLDMSAARFEAVSRARIAGRRTAIHRSAIIDVPAFTARRWTTSYRYARKGLIGRPIDGCVAHVHTIPPPSGED